MSQFLSLTILVFYTIFITIYVQMMTKKIHIYRWTKWVRQSSNWKLNSVESEIFKRTQAEFRMELKNLVTQLENTRKCLVRWMDQIKYRIPVVKDRVEEMLYKQRIWKTYINWWGSSMRNCATPWKVQIFES